MKYLSAILVFLFAVALQLWFAPGGVRGDFALAAMIVFAFLFDLWPLVLFSLFGVFLLNPSLHPSLAALMLIVVPLSVFFFRKRFSLDPWLGVPISILLGIGIFYVVIAPFAVLYFFWPLVLDIAVCALFGEVVWYGMEG